MSRPRIDIRYALSSLASVLFVLAQAPGAEAQTSVSASQNTPLATSSAGDVTIVSGGSINVGGGAAVTIDSNNSVTNGGAIAGNDGNNMTGILVTAGSNCGTTACAIANTGTITITDSTLATTIPLTGGSYRYGIQINNASPFVGSITNESGASITVRGNNSAGIYLTPSTPGVVGGLNGSITNAGFIGVTGNNSYGILQLVNAPITGGISITDSITALGTNSGGLSLAGGVQGQLYIDSNVRADGFYNGSVTVSRPGSFTGLTANNLLLGGPAVSITNSITGGIDIDTDGVVVSYGSAPALVIGGAGTQIGSNNGSYGIMISGAVNANGIYDRIGASAVQIGGNPGDSPTIYGGIDVVGKINSNAYAANATGLTVSTGGTVPNLVNSGKIEATVQYGAGGNATVGGNATAILVNGGALSSITNTGTISATTANGIANALDLSGDTALVTVIQSPSGTTTPSSITGNVLFGSSGAILDLGAGTLTGAVAFGNSTLNQLNITNGAILGGALTQASGGALAVDVADGRLDSTSTTNLVLSSLTIGPKGQIDFAADPTTGQNGSVTVAGVGAVMISSGAKVGLDLDSRLVTPQTFTLIQTTPSAGALVGQSSVLLGDVPYFYNATIVTNTAAGTIALDVIPRAFVQAGVGGSASAYNAVFAANYLDPGIRDAFNGASSQQAFKRQYQQMLPSYSGGLFEVLAAGSDAVVRAQAGNPLVENGNHGGGWAQSIGFGADDSGGSSPGYHGGGLGFALGWEAPASPISTWGVSLSYMRASVDDFNTGPANQEVGTVYSTGAYWREVDGALRTDASLNVGVAEMNSTRNFDGTDLTGATVSRTANANWTGGIAQAHLGISYEQPIGEFYIKPSVAGDYFVLYEGSRNEHDGGNGFDLNVASGTGKQGAVVGGLTLGTQFGDRLFMWRPELMVGYKQVFGGADTVAAQFAGGSSFSLSPQSQKGGPIAHVGMHGGDKYSDFAFEAGGEDRGDLTSFDGRVVARFKF